MNTSCSNKFIRNVMFGFNFVFVITGIIILAVGVSVKAYYTPYNTFLDEKYFSLPNMLIATGSLIFFISFLGCYGAMRENWLLLMAFAVLLTIIFIFELSVGIAGYVLRDKTSTYLENTLYTSMVNYTTTPSISSMWDTIQEEFQCCGVQSVTDWYNTFKNYSLPLTCCPLSGGFVGAFYCNSYTNVTTTSVTAIPETTATESTTAETEKPTSVNDILTELTEPDTTVSVTDAPTTAPVTDSPTTASVATEKQDPVDNYADEISYPPSSSEPYSSGCHSLFTNFVKKHAVDIGAVGISLAVIQLAGIFLSFHLARQLKNGYYST